MQSIRYLYSGEELGIKKYEESRKLAEHAIANHQFFKHNFRKLILHKEFNQIRIEYGLKNLLHIMINSSSDVSILRDALCKLIQMQTECEGEKYRFDSIIMRTFYFLNMPDEAIEVIICFEYWFHRLFIPKFDFILVF